MIAASWAMKADPLFLTFVWAALLMGQLVFLGIVGEYVGAIHTQVLRRPLVIEKERINFSAQDRKE